MKLASADECCVYVESQLDALVRSNGRIHAARSTDVPGRPLTWRLGSDPPGTGWYTLEARLAEEKFLVWFGNHQVGAEGIHWIMRPAVHIAFDDLWPRSDLVAIHSSLSDVLVWMFRSMDQPGFALRFETNTFSLT
jgi:hypothetical protein